MPHEKCESAVANKLAEAHDKTRGSDEDLRIAVKLVCDAVQMQEAEMEKLRDQARVVLFEEGAKYEDTKSSVVNELQVHLAGESQEFVWLRLITKDGKTRESLYMKGGI